jgi:hypothetical protein
MHTLHYCTFQQVNVCVCGQHMNRVEMREGEGAHIYRPDVTDIKYSVNVYLNICKNTCELVNMFNLTLL